MGLICKGRVAGVLLLPCADAEHAPRIGPSFLSVLDPLVCRMYVPGSVKQMTAVIPRWLNLGVLVQSSEHEREEPGNSACQGCLVSPRQAAGVRLSPPIRLSRVASCKETRTQALRFFFGTCCHPNTFTCVLQSSGCTMQSHRD
jgi:hypothetical protein